MYTRLSRWIYWREKTIAACVLSNPCVGFLLGNRFCKLIAYTKIILLSKCVLYASNAYNIISIKLVPKTEYAEGSTYHWAWQEFHVQSANSFLANWLFQWYLVPGREHDSESNFTAFISESFLARMYNTTLLESNLQLYPALVESAKRFHSFTGYTFDVLKD